MLTIFENIFILKVRICSQRVQYLPFITSPLLNEREIYAEELSPCQFRLLKFISFYQKSTKLMLKIAKTGADSINLSTPGSEN